MLEIYDSSKMMKKRRLTSPEACMFSLAHYTYIFQQFGEYIKALPGFAKQILKEYCHYLQPPKTGFFSTFTFFNPWTAPKELHNKNTLACNPTYKHNTQLKNVLIYV